MNIVQLSYPLRIPAVDIPDTPQVMSIGDFDGVHLGHQNVIRRALSIGRQTGRPVSIMTFHPHPREVLGLDQYAQYLTPLEKKTDVFARMGVDRTYIVHFDRSFSQLSPQQFVDDMLVPLRVGTVVVGFDFTFGYQGIGTPGTLRQLAQGRMNVEVVEPCHLDGDKVSSTLIREKLQQGDMDKVRRLLGRSYSISGTVVKGEGRGRTIGFPTANIEADAPYVIPKQGVYAVHVAMGGNSYRGVMNIGVKPTFHQDAVQPTLEVHILDFSKTIYGETVTIEFETFLREERKFSSVERLIEQIHRDVERARAYHLQS